MNYIKGILSAAVAIVLFFSSCTSHADPPINTMDKSFMVSATYSNLAEIEFGNLALSKSANDSVKMFASLMITDHTKNQQSINDSLASSFGFSASLPATMDENHLEIETILSQLEGYDFDTAYMNLQIADHLQAISLYNSEVNGFYNIQLRDFAAASIPLLQMHLELAQSVKETLHP